MNKNLFKTILLVAAIFTISANASATKHIITVNDPMSFSPASGLVVQVGDTVVWNYTGSSFHTTTSTQVPAGAATWNVNLPSPTSTYEYKVLIAGNYKYKCLPHETMGMMGEFDAITITSMINVSQASFSLVPNPATNELRLTGNVKDIKITAYDLSGRFVRELEMTNNNSSEKIYSLEGMMQGYYMLYIKADNVLFTEKLMIVR